MAAPGCTCSFPAARVPRKAGPSRSRRPPRPREVGDRLSCRESVPPVWPYVDETWVAMVDRTMILTPISAQGLVWIDPSRVEGAIGSRSAVSPNVRAALAWRWNGENATARVDREQAEQKPRAEIQYRSRIEQDGKHLAVEGQILIKPGSNPLNVLPVWISQPAGGSQDWSFPPAPKRKSSSDTPWTIHRGLASSFPRPAWPGTFRSARPSWEKAGFTSRLGFPGTSAVPFP